MTDKSWELLTKLINVCGYDVAEIEDEFDFDELCDDIKNKLARKTQECEALKSESFTREELITIQEKEIEELKDKLAVTQFNLEQKCKVLKDVGVVQDKNGGYQVMGINHYRKALEEIEGLISDDEFIRCPINDDVNCNYFTRNKILDIIDKAKGEGNE